jgi:hypothetical protein
MLKKLFEYFILAIFVLLILVVVWFSFGLDIWQEIQDSKWKKYILEETTLIHDAILIPNKNYLVLGATKSPNQQIIYKINNQGKIIFKEYFNEFIKSIIPTKDKNYLLFSDDNSSIIKINQQGKRVWQKTIKIKLKTKHDDSIGFDEIISVEDGYLIIGTNSNKTFLIKINNQGDILWYKNYNFLNNVEDIIKTKDNNLIVLGSDLGEDLNMLLKLNSKGELLEKKVYEEYTNSYFHSIHPTQDKKYIIAGTHRSNGNIKSGILLKSDFKNIDWYRDYNAEFGLDISLEEVINTQDGNWLVLGSKNEGRRGGSYNGYILKVSLLGETIWKKSYGTQAYDDLTGVINTENNSIVFGYCSHPSDYPNSAGCIFKINSKGDIIKDFFIQEGNI